MGEQVIAEASFVGDSTEISAYLIGLGDHLRDDDVFDSYDDYRLTIRGGAVTDMTGSSIEMSKYLDSLGRRIAINPQKLSLTIKLVSL